MKRLSLSIVICLMLLTTQSVAWDSPFWQTPSSGRLATAGGTMTGELITATPTTGGAGLRLPHGTAPSSPVNGQCWTTTVGLYCRINSSTVGPYAIDHVETDPIVKAINGVICSDGSTIGACSDLGALDTTGNAGSADTLSAQYIDWSASSGPTSIKNKPTVTPTGELIQIQTFDSTSDVTYTSHVDATKIFVRMVGGGGPGGDCTGDLNKVCAASGGGGGTYGEFWENVTGATDYEIVVGGSAAYSQIILGGSIYRVAGGQSGNSMVAGTSLLISEGGYGTRSAPYGTYSLLVGGNYGNPGIRLSGTVGISGGGGTSYLGQLPYGGIIQKGNGVAGDHYGTGGGGALSTDATSYTGGAGAHGVIIIEEYK